MFSNIKQLVMDQFETCPKSGKIVGLKKSTNRTFLLWFVTGLASVIWFALRVIPKPSRAAYPCQQVAQPIAAGFLMWLVQITSIAIFIKHSRILFQNNRYVIGSIFFALALASIFTLNMYKTDAGVAATFAPTDPANSPMGVARGIHPGRVVWVHDDKLCDQKSTSGWWWTDLRTDPQVARNMMERAILNLTGKADPVDAWDALFKNFNKTRYNQEGIGYQAGDKIAIKINNIFSRSYAWTSSQDNRPSPQMTYALIDQLVNKAGVPEEDITFYDCIFYHGDPVYDYCHKDFPKVRWAEGDATDRSGYESGPGSNPGTREKVVRDPKCVVHYGDPGIVKGSGEVCLPTVVSEAKYVMSVGLPRAHNDLAGYTGVAKNFFGSVWHPTEFDYYHQWSPQAMHASISAADGNPVAPVRPMGSYNALVDLMGHKDLGGKSVLLLVEAIRYKYWAAPPFNGNPASSIFMSQDFVAIESVLIDFMRSEGGLRSGTLDNYLHEASQADNPPSGTVYDPENDGVRLASLGAHEHWNNSTDKQYTRNLGTGEGIELLQILTDTVYVDEPVITTPLGFDDIREFTNYPNPFKTETTIAYSLASNANVRIGIYDLNGSKIRLLLNQNQSAGNHKIIWDGQNESGVDVAAGIYICKMQINIGDKVIQKTRQLVRSN